MKPPFSIDIFHDNNIFKMQKKIDPEVEYKVRLLSELKWSPKKVLNEINKNGNVISRRSEVRLD